MNSVFGSVTISELTEAWKWFMKSFAALKVCLSFFYGCGKDDYGYWTQPTGSASRASTERFLQVSLQVAPMLHFIFALRLNLFNIALNL